jgi:hypothetical protein
MQSVIDEIKKLTEDPDTDLRDLSRTSADRLGVRR